MPLFQPSADIGLTSKITDAVYRYLAGKTDEDNAILFCEG